MQTTSSVILIRRAEFVDPEELICPGCGEQVRCAPPEDWPAHDGLPAAEFSHQDATALCRTRSGAVAEPIEAPVRVPR